MEQIQAGVRNTTNTQLKNNCRACGEQLIPYINFGKTPLVNRLYSSRSESLSAEKFPLELLRCPNCGNSQLSVVVDPRILYANYPYRSAVSKTFVNHCSELAKEIKNYTNGGDVILDIAGNDGTLMSEIVREIPNIIPIVLDPSEDAISNVPRDINTECKFWSRETSEIIAREYGFCKVITAQNVVAHVDDLNDFFSGISLALLTDGIFIMEVPYIGDMLSGAVFEAVYHEHLSYMSIHAIKEISSKYSLEIFDVKFLPIHCGTMRVYIKWSFNKNIKSGVIPNEKFLTYSNAYYDFKKQSFGRLNRLKKYLNLNSGKNIIGVTASAKGNVILNLIGNDYEKISYIVDNADSKIGKFSPGIGLEIKPFISENVESADIAIILANNIEKEMTENLIKHGFKGEIFTP